jgi:hypothetical protein
VVSRLGWVVVVVFSVAVNSAIVVVACSPVHGGVVGRSVQDGGCGCRREGPALVFSIVDHGGGRGVSGGHGEVASSRVTV